MKNLVLIFSILILVSCSNSDDSGDVITNKFEQIKSILPQGEWKVTHFFEDNANHTTDFESFIFTFKEDGTVEGKTDLYTETGTWSYVSYPDTGEQLILDFNGTPPFEEIAEDWNIVSVSITKIELSAGVENSENTKLLTFSKL